MKSNIKKIGNTIVVSVNGKLDYETQEPLKENLTKIARTAQTDSVPTKVLFNLEKLEFVGSSGISQFIQTLKDFGSRTEQKASIISASSEFKKVMRAFDDDQIFEFYENEESANRGRDC